MSSMREPQRPEVEDDDQFIPAAIDENTSKTNAAADDEGLDGCKTTAVET
jgi:hypothetical protein